ncbi:MAG: response regulator [Deltaproteobacteria bacterium]|nr:response regulator [Deltaproteobacteria bacterium]
MMRVQNPNPKMSEPEYLRRLYKYHYQGAWLRSGASLFMWLFALTAYGLHLIGPNNFFGISATVVYLILINPPVLWLLRRISNRRLADGFSLFVNLLDVIGYTAVIYFLGGIRALYLTPLYAVLTAYLGAIGPWRLPFIVASFCGIALAGSVALEHFGFLPSQDPLQSMPLPGLNQAAIVITVICYLQVAAFVSAYTGRLLKRSERDLRKKNIELEEKTNHLQYVEKELLIAQQAMEKRVIERTSDLRNANKQLNDEISVRRRAEEALRESEERYRQLSDGITDVFFALDRGLNCVFWNKSSENLTGIPAAEAIGTSFYELFAGIKGSMIEQLCINVLSTGEANSSESEIEIKSTRYFLDVNVYPTPSGIVVLAKDITYRKLVEEEKQTLQYRLNAVKRVDAIATLAGGIAHQFNNKISAITGYLDLASINYEDRDKVARYFKSMRESARSMTQLTEQLLAYARGGKYRVKEVVMSDFIRDTLPVLLDSLKDSMEVETKLPPDVRSVEADVTQLQMVLSAILNNASEALEGKGRIRISCANEAISQDRINGFQVVPGRYVCVSIEDNGKGMDEVTKQRIFEPFFTTKSTGRGLGMAAVYGIVKNHGGWITVASEMGKGTIVRLYFPALEPHAVEEENEKPDTPELGGTILVIEDEEMVMNVTSEMLEAMGYRVLRAKTGKEALEIAKTFDREIDLAILDVVLPDMGGKALYLLLVEARPNLKVIVCSGYSVDGPAREILNAGAEGFLQKPLTISQLSRKLKEILSVVPLR